jgi:Na+-transporting NADH:ubiquinone oxidoreductase subunit NqrB
MKPFILMGAVFIARYRVGCSATIFYSESESLTELTGHILLVSLLFKTALIINLLCAY